MKNLITRSLTGLLLVVFVLGGFGLHPVTFFLVQLVILSGSMYEYYRLSGKSLSYVVPGIAGGIFLYVFSVLVASGIASARIYLLLLPLVPGMMIAELYKRNGDPAGSVANALFPLIYIALPWSLFPFTAFGSSAFPTFISSSIDSFSPAAALAFILILWANDTGAYLFGVSIGRHRLFESVSPKKSWEGFFGGMVSAIAASWFLSGWFGFEDPLSGLITGLLVSVGATFGDLVESLIKRKAGVKDSGNILPGHGGFLDRFDSILIAWPAVFIYITFFG